MKVGELSNIVYPRQAVKVVSLAQPMFIGEARELVNCEFKDQEIKELYTGAIDHDYLCIEITHRGGYFNDTNIR